MVCGPVNVVEWWTRNTEGGVAEVIVTWRLGKEGAVVWFGRAADVAR